MTTPRRAVQAFKRSVGINPRVELYSAPQLSCDAADEVEFACGCEDRPCGDQPLGVMVTSDRLHVTPQMGMPEAGAGRDGCGERRKKIYAGQNHRPSTKTISLPRAATETQNQRKARDVIGKMTEAWRKALPDSTTGPNRGEQRCTAKSARMPHSSKNDMRISDEQTLNAKKNIPAKMSRVFRDLRYVGRQHPAPTTRVAVVACEIGVEAFAKDINLPAVVMSTSKQIAIGSLGPRRPLLVYHSRLQVGVIRRTTTD